MTTILASKPSRFVRLALVLSGVVAASAACGASQPVLSAAPDTASSATPPRQPDGVVLEPPTAMPSALTVATARGVVTLRPSLSSEAVRACVEQLLEAWQHGALDALSALLTSDAGPLEARARGPGSLVESFRQRLRARDYKHLEGLELTRLDHVEHYASSELGGPDAPARPADMRADEILVRVPLEVTQLAGEKYFEPAITLLVRGEQGKVKIAAYGEGP